MSKLEFPLEGDIWIVKFDKLKEFSKLFRPCLVVSNNFQNEFDEKNSSSSNSAGGVESIEPFEVFIKNSSETGLDVPSKILCNYLHTFNKRSRLVGTKRIGIVSPEIMEKVERALKITLNLGS